MITLITLIAPSARRPPLPSFPHLLPHTHSPMAVAAPYNDLQPVRRIDEAEAQRISNRIDEELRVRTRSVFYPF